MVIPIIAKARWINRTIIAATNHTKRETIVDTSTERPFDHFLGSLGGSTFQMGIKHTLVAKTPKTQASPELALSAILFELSDKMMKIAGIIVEGTVPITLPTAPPYFSIKQATAIAIKKATDAERVGFRKFVLYFFIKFTNTAQLITAIVHSLKTVIGITRKKNDGLGQPCPSKSSYAKLLPPFCLLIVHQGKIQLETQSVLPLFSIIRFGGKQKFIVISLMEDILSLFPITNPFFFSNMEKSDYQVVFDFVRVCHLVLLHSYIYPYKTRIWDNLYFLVAHLIV